jgi:hypothetical protein
MGKHTKEWIDNELDVLTEEKQKNFSLQDKNHEIPMAKVYFGEEYVPVPQSPMFVAGITRGGNCTLRQGIRDGLDSEVRAIAKERNVPLTEETQDAIIAEIIYEKGTYYVFHQAFTSGFHWEMSLYFENEETEEFVDFEAEDCRMPQTEALDRDM